MNFSEDHGSGKESRRHGHKAKPAPIVRAESSPGCQYCGGRETAALATPRDCSNHLDSSDAKIDLIAGRKVKNTFHPGAAGFLEIPLDDIAAIKEVRSHLAALLDNSLRNGLPLYLDGFPLLKRLHVHVSGWDVVENSCPKHLLLEFLFGHRTSARWPTGLCQPHFEPGKQLQLLAMA